GFVRLLVYYGTYEDVTDPEVQEQGGGRYEGLLGRTRRIQALDPFWRYPAVYGAAALGFNLKRPDEALLVLDDALKMRPGDERLLAMVGAVGFQKDGDPARALDRLMPAADSPDAPSLLVHLAAFMSERLGRREQAVRLYRRLLDSRAPGYAEWARRGLARLGEPAGGA
ncbi:MAG: hypothetical protein KGL53_15940, partial [Elusimicrobia bacterium]|nr:hypothetical protein [Elusimicrobiota bacterium]